MQRTAFIAQLLVRITGVIQIVLGLLFWFGIATSLVMVHMTSGLIFVIAIWLLAIVAIRAKARPGLAGVTILYGVLVIALGMYQGVLLPGPAHWIIRVVHLLVGLGAMGIAQSLTTGIQAKAPR